MDAERDRVRALRRAIADRIEADIAILDALTPDVDLEDGHMTSRTSPSRCEGCADDHLRSQGAGSRPEDTRDAAEEAIDLVGALSAIFAYGEEVGQLDSPSCTGGAAVGRALHHLLCRILRDLNAAVVPADAPQAPLPAGRARHRARPVRRRGGGPARRRPAPRPADRRAQRGRPRHGGHRGRDRHRQRRPRYGRAPPGRRGRPAGLRAAGGTA